MIDFENKSFVKMKQVSNEEFQEMLTPILVQGEQIVSSYRTMRDGVVFTNYRIISINVQGVTGKKKDFTSIPYNRIQVFSTETSGVLDLDSELEIWISSVGKIKFEFSGATNISEICKLISSFLFLK